MKTSTRSLKGLGLGLGVLLLAILACGVPHNLDDLSYSGAGGGPYYTCKTATPMPTVTYVVSEMTATPNALGTPSGEVVYEYGLTTPMPTETPFYRQGEFYLNQPAIIGGGAWEVSLVSVATDATHPEYTQVTMALRNHGSTDLAVALSVQLFVPDAQGEARLYNSDAQRLLALPNPALADTPLIPAGQEIRRTLAFASPVERVGLNLNWLNSVARPIWFLPSADPKVVNEQACLYGPADWLPGTSDLDESHLEPPPAPAGQYTVRPMASSGRYPVVSPFYIASTHGGNVAGVHHGYDYTSCYLLGCKWPDDTTPPDTWLLRIGNTRPIYAALAGEVLVAECGWNFGYGCFAIVRSQIGPDDYLYTYYGHLWGGGSVPGSFRTGTGIADPTCDPGDCNRTTISVLGDGPGPLVSAGQQISCWTPIGFVGMSGKTSGPHLHFEMRRGAFTTGRGGTWVDPEDWRALWCQPGGAAGGMLP